MGNSNRRANHGVLTLPSGANQNGMNNFDFNAAEFRDNRDAINAALEASLKEAPLPIGWDEVSLGKGLSYFVDHVNRSTTFQDPRLVNAGIPSSNLRLSKKRKMKLPKYKDDLYGKTRRFIAALHATQSDEGELKISVSRESLFQDSYSFIVNLDVSTLCRRLFIEFLGEEGLDYGGMSREWFLSLTEEFFKPERHLFVKHPKGYCYRINKHSSQNPQHLEHFYFVGLVIGMAIYHGKLFYGHFDIPFYRLLLKRPPKFSDLKHWDKDVYSSMKKVRAASDVEGWDLYFMLTEKNAEGKLVDVPLKEGGEDITVTNQNKSEFLDLVVRYYSSSIETQVEQIRRGLSHFVPESLLEEFSPSELEQLIGGIEPDVNDLRANTNYMAPLDENHPTVKLFWEVVQAMTPDELRQLIHFTTGTDKVPIGGFAHLVGSTGAQLFTLAPKKTAGLPTAHSCFNRLELAQYFDKAVLKKELTLSVTEASGFGLE